MFSQPSTCFGWATLPAGPAQLNSAQTSASCLRHGAMACLMKTPARDEASKRGPIWSESDPARAKPKQIGDGRLAVFFLSQLLIKGLGMAREIPDDPRLALLPITAWYCIYKSHGGMGKTRQDLNIMLLVLLFHKGPSSSSFMCSTYNVAAHCSFTKNNKVN